MLALPACAADDANPIGRFDIVRFDVAGSKLLSPQEIERTLAPFAGRNRDFGHVQRALEALEDAYRRRGFNVVRVVLPEQELNHGAVRLVVIEARIGRVRIEGNRFFGDANIRASLPDLREGETPNLARISSSLRLANHNPARKTSLQLQSAEEDAQIDATLRVTDDKPWRAGMHLDNTGNPGTGRSHLGLLLQHANLTGRDDVLSMQYTTTLEKPSQVSVYGAGYRLPLYGPGDSIDLYANYSEVDSGVVSAGIVDLQVSGKGTVVGGRYNQILGRRGAVESTLIYGFDYKAFKNNVALQGVQLGNDVTVRPLNVTYAGVWTAPAGELHVGLTAYRNLPGGDRGRQADFDRVRAGASAGYSMLRYSAGYSRALPADWLMRLAISGQATRDALVPGEQFGAGGASTVRGFTERDVASDQGQLASAELYTPSLCGTFRAVAAQCRALVFFDAARVSRNKILPGEAAQASIGSVGVGLRMNVDKYLTLHMDLGHAVDAGVSGVKGGNRLHVRLGLSY
jgi:hemolysin activation/secretion protein